MKMLTIIVTIFIPTHFYRRHLRDELREYAGTELALRQFCSAWSCVIYSNRHAGLVPMDEVYVIVGNFPIMVLIKKCN